MWKVTALRLRCPLLKNTCSENTAFKMRSPLWVNKRVHFPKARFTDCEQSVLHSPHRLHTNFFYSHQTKIQCLLNHPLSPLLRPPTSKPLQRSYPSLGSWANPQATSIRTPHLYSFLSNEPLPANKWESKEHPHFWAQIFGQHLS